MFEYIRCLKIQRIFVEWIYSLNNIRIYSNIQIFVSHWPKHKRSDRWVLFSQSIMFSLGPNTAVKLGKSQNLVQTWKFSIKSGKTITGNIHGFTSSISNIVVPLILKLKDNNCKQIGKNQILAFYYHILTYVQYIIYVYNLL